MTDNNKYNTLYLLPKRNYFSQGDRGRVTHALGVISGIGGCGSSVTAISGNGLINYNSQLPDKINLIEVDSKRTFWSMHFLKTTFFQIRNNKIDILIIRYAVSKLIICFIISLFAKKYGVKIVIEVNSYAINNKSIPSLFRLFYRYIEIGITSRFDTAYVVSRALGNLLNQYNCKSKIAIIPNGAFLPEYDIKENTSNISILRLVYLGSLHKYYDYDILLNGYRKLIKSGISCELHFYGTGSMYEYIKSKTLDLKKVHYHGRYKREDISRELFKNTDILVLPPKQIWDVELSGGLSTKLFEYMSLGLSIIAPKMGEVAEILSDNNTAIMYDPNDTDSYLRACIKLCNSKELRSTIGVNSQKLFMKKYTWESRMKSLLDIVNRE